MLNLRGCLANFRVGLLSQVLGGFVAGFGGKEGP
jgi:hypothetical protein